MLNTDAFAESTLARVVAKSEDDTVSRPSVMRTTLGWRSAGLWASIRSAMFTPSHMAVSLRGVRRSTDCVSLLLSVVRPWITSALLLKLTIAIWSCGCFRLTKSRIAACTASSLPSWLIDPDVSTAITTPLGDDVNGTTPSIFTGLPSSFTAKSAALVPGFVGMATIFTLGKAVVSTRRTVSVSAPKAAPAPPTTRSIASVRPANSFFIACPRRAGRIPPRGTGRR